MVKRALGVGLAVLLMASASACSGPSSSDTSSVADDKSTPAGSDSESAEAEGGGEPAAADDVDAGKISVHNSEDFAELLAGPSFGPAVEAFFEEHQGETLVLDGHITFVIDSEKAVYSTATIAAGDAGSTALTGPLFEFTPVLLPSTSPLQSADLQVGTNVRVTALIGSYYSFEESSTFKPDRDTRIVLVADSVESR